MLSSIHPLGERARGNRWGVTAGAYIVASTLGGGLLGVATGLLGRVLGVIAGRGTTAPLVVGSAACLMAAVLDAAASRGLRLPTIRRQVNEDWLNRYRGWVYGAGFGGQLGFGFVTIVTTAAIYLMEVLTVMAGWIAPSWMAALAAGSGIGATFGLARAMPLLLGFSARSPDRLRMTHRGLVAREPLARVLTISSMAVAGGILGWAVVV